MYNEKKVKRHYYINFAKQITKYISNWFRFCYDSMQVFIFYIFVSSNLFTILDIQDQILNIKMYYEMYCPSAIGRRFLVATELCS